MFVLNTRNFIVSSDLTIASDLTISTDILLIWKMINFHNNEKQWTTVDFETQWNELALSLYNEILTQFFWQIKMFFHHYIFQKRNKRNLWSKIPSTKLKENYPGNIKQSNDIQFKYNFNILYFSLVFIKKTNFL